jgi:hypothetical protein
MFKSEAETTHTTFECIFLLRSFFLGGTITGIPTGFVEDEVANPEEYLLLMTVALTDESLRKVRKVYGRDSVEEMVQFNGEGCTNRLLSSIICSSISEYLSGVTC